MLVRARVRRHPASRLAVLRGVLAAGVAATAVSLFATQASLASGVHKSIDLSGVTLNLGEIYGAEEAEIEASGVLDGAPYKVSWSVFPSPAPVLTALEAGDLDAGINLGDAGVEIADASGTPWTRATEPIQAIAVYGTVHPVIETIARSSTGITKLSQIKGHTFVYNAGGDTQEQYLFDLQYEHLKATDVTPIVVSGAALVATFQSGNGDVFAGPSTQFFPLTQSGQARVIATSKQVGVPALGAVIANTSSLSNPAKKAALSDFLGRLTAFWAWYAKHIPRDAAILETTLAVPAQYARETAVLGESYMTPLTHELLTEEQDATNALYSSGTIQTKVNITPLFDTTFNGVISAANKKYGVAKA